MVGKAGEVFALEDVERSVNAKHARVMAEVEGGRAVVVGDAVDVGRGCAVGDALEGVPAVVGVVPRAATDVDVARTGIALLVGKTVGVAAIVLIVEVVVGIAVDDHVVASAAQLDAGIAAAVDVELLEDVVASAFHPDALVARIADGEPSDVEIAATDLDGICFQGLVAEVEDGSCTFSGGNENHLVGGSAAVDAQL